MALVSQHWHPPIPRLLVEGMGITSDFHVLLVAADIIGSQNFFAHCLNVRCIARIKNFWQVLHCGQEGQPRVCSVFLFLACSTTGSTKQ